MPIASRYVQVAVSGPARQTFTYRLPDSNLGLQTGQRVLVPFGRRKRVGFYIDDAVKPSGLTIKDVESVVDPVSIITPLIAKLCLWIADYYFANPADCFSAALPPQVRQGAAVHFVWTSEDTDYLPKSVARLVKNGKRLSPTALKRLHAVGPDLISRLLKENRVAETAAETSHDQSRRLKGYRLIDRSRWPEVFDRVMAPVPFEGLRTASELKAAGVSDHYRRKAQRAGVLEAVYEDRLTPVMALVQPRGDFRQLVPTLEQASVVDQVVANLDEGFRPWLLHGVTGSGKTLVYCKIIDEVITRNRTALLLTPEIALSANTLAYIRGYFGDAATVIHSAMSPAERLTAWRGVRDGRYKIVVGPRSALFAPLEQPGLVIVDEEHDESYKQDEPAPRFHGRDCALMLARMADIPVMLGSASPSVESYHHAVSGRYGMLELRSRPRKAKLPKVRIIDMQEHGARGDLSFVSLPLKLGVEEHLKAGRQVILYLNRRGYAPHLRCSACGHVPACGDCRVRLTYHKTTGQLVCHYCNSTRSDYAVCERCGERHLRFMGAGTQKVEEAVASLFPQARAARFDSDSVSGRGKAWRLLDEFSQGKYNVLLGTQMVTKGLDLPEVSLVGVLAADQGLHMPDFRASERTFARLLQVAGRSGRSAHPGEVLVQAMDPEHFAISLAARQDYEAFFRLAIGDRKAAGFPPFNRLVRFILDSPTDSSLVDHAVRFRQDLDRLVRPEKLAVSIIGPTACGIYKLRKKFRQHIIAKVPIGKQIRFVRALTAWEKEQTRFGMPAEIRVTVDVDPVDFM